MGSMLNRMVLSGLIPYGGTLPGLLGLHATIYPLGRAHGNPPHLSLLATASVGRGRPAHQPVNPAGGAAGNSHLVVIRPADATRPWRLEVPCAAGVGR
jgi:hypothetical protein